MAGRFLPSSWTRSPLPPEVEDARGELSRLARDRPSLAGPAALLGELLPCLYRDVGTDPPPALTPEQAATKLAGGVPLLRGEALSVDGRALARRWRECCAVLQRHPGKEAARDLAAALRRGRPEPVELLQHVLAGRADAVHARADALGLDAGLVATVLRLTAFPLLTRFQGALVPLRGPTPWPYGYCPVCGSWPLLGEFRGLEQTRLLRCGLCAAEWERSRRQCPFCGNHDHRSLGFLHVEGEEGKYRASTCDQCRGYVKMVNTLTALAPPHLLVADLATVHLDLAAAERGYAVTLSAE